MIECHSMCGLNRIWSKLQNATKDSEYRLEFVRWSISVEIYCTLYTNLQFRNNKVFSNYKNHKLLSDFNFFVFTLNSVFLQIISRQESTLFVFFCLFCRHWRNKSISEQLEYKRCAFMWHAIIIMRILLTVIRTTELCKVQGLCKIIPSTENAVHAW